MNVFDYSDYRALLRDWYQEKKTENPKFSYRLLAQKIGFKSPGFFTMILKGKTNISIGFIESFADFMKLNRKEKDYFQTLVLFNQAKDHPQRRRQMEKLLAFKESHVKALDPSHYEFMEKWYHIAVRELLGVHEFRGDYRELGRMLVPAISAEEARKAVEMLLRLGMIRKNAQGVFERVDRVLTTGYDAEGVAIHNFFLAMHKLGGEALDRFPREERNLSWLTLCISKTTYNQIVEELRSFRRKALDMARQDRNSEGVFQFNFQVFPLSKLLPGKKP